LSIDAENEQLGILIGIIHASRTLGNDFKVLNGDVIASDRKLTKKSSPWQMTIREAKD